MDPRRLDQPSRVLAASGTRRALLAVASALLGGLAPAGWPEEVDAAPHPVRRVQKRAARRRQRRHHRLEQKRRQQRRAGQPGTGPDQPPAGDDVFRNVRVEVINHLGRSVKVIWYYNDSQGRQVRNLDLADGQGAADSNGDLVMTTLIQPLPDDSPIFVYFQNLKFGPTSAKVWFDHSSNYIDQWFFQGDTADTTINNTHLRLHRADDSTDFVNLQVQVTPR